MAPPKTPFQSGAAVAAYFRDSGGDEQELSVDRQEAEFIRWCAANGLTPGRVFKDVARIGSSSVGREKFNEMMAYFRSGKAGEAGLVIWNYQRFARQVDDSQFYRADLRRRGYIFHSLNDVIPDGPMGRFVEAALDWKNEQFLLDLSTDVKSGLRHLIETYGAVPGTPPRGFKREPIHISDHRDGRPRIVHRWVPDPELIPRVRQAFEMYVAGAPLAELIAVTGLYTSTNSWRTFFDNRLYIGILDYGDITVEGYCEPIIAADVWDAAQAKHTRRAGSRHMQGDNPEHPRRNGAVYVLTGMAYCAECGSPLSGMTTGRPGVRHERYVCSRRTRRRDCAAQGVPRQWLEAIVIDALRDCLADPQHMIAAQAAILQESAQEADRLAERRADLQARLAGLRRRITNLNAALAEADAAPASTIKTIAGLELEEARLQRDLAELSIQARDYAAVPDDEIARRSRAALAALDAAGPRELHTALRSILHRAVIERDGPTVRLSLELFAPPLPDHPPPVDSAPMGRPTLGAHRHTRIYLTATLTRKPRARR